MTVEGYGELISAQVIWDRDNGPENEGWYLRQRWDRNGLTLEEDTVFDFDAVLTLESTDAEVISSAVIYLHHPDGMSDAEREELRAMIEVKR